MSDSIENFIEKLEKELNEEKDDKIEDFKQKFELEERELQINDDIIDIIDIQNF